MKMKDLCPSERPREKMLHSGARATSSGDLLAILLRTGVPGTSAADLAQLILSSVDGKLSVLSGMSIERLCRIKGVGTGKALAIAAAMELGRRAFAEVSVPDKIPVTCSRAAAKAMFPKLKGLDHEECWLLLLNRSHYIIGMEKISSGGPSSTSPGDIRILKRIIEKEASSVILFHNHPSGNPHPGEADIRFTDQIRRAVSSIGCPLIDHIIISEDSYFSFSESKVALYK